VIAYAIVSSRLSAPTLTMRSMKMRLPVRRRWTSSRTSRVSLNALAVRSVKPLGRSALTPPTRPYEIVSRAPVTSSTSSQRNSRALIM